MHHLLVDRYSRLDSPLHRVDPRVKLAGTFFFVAVESSLPRLDAWGALSLALLPLFLAAISELPAAWLLRRVALASPFVALLVLYQPFTPGTVVARPLGLAVSSQGLVAAGVLATKFLADVLATLLLVATTPFEELARALAWWRAPRLLVEVTATMFRYTFVLWDELERAARTARARNLALAPPRRRLRAWVRVLGSHLLRSLARGERVYQAMQLRGFRDGLSLRPLPSPRLADLGWALLYAGLPLAAGARALLLAGGNQ